ncbi:MAG: sugar transferase, partial [Acidimicrobiales bacterium]|nr:sugar transferase [Acidimicrobiales bacterium]
MTWTEALIGVLREGVLLALALAAPALAGALLAQVTREVLFGASLTVDGEHVPYLLVAVVAVLSWLAILALSGAYEHKILGSGTEEYRRILRAAVGALAVAVLGVFLTRAQVARGFVMSLAPLVAAWTLFGRYLARNWLARQRAKGLQMRRVVVLGRPDAVLEAVRHFRGALDQGYAVVSACVVGEAPEEVVEELAMPVLPPGDPLAAVTEQRAEILAIAGTEALPTGALRTLAWDLEGTGVDLMVVPTITDVAGPRVSVQPVAGLPLLLVEPPRLTGGARVVKSLIDRVTAVVLLVLLSPVLLVIAALVRFTSRGPAIFRQTRIGRDGKPFTMWKFRTMTERAEQDLDKLVTLNEHDGLLFKIRDDPRRTAVGRWLRRFSLDELPQIAHVASGKMSLVGPRP